MSNRANPISNSYRTWFFLAMADLLAAAVIGLVLRAMYIVEIPFVRFRPWLHAHSHTALLGWLFLGIVVVLLHDGGQGRIDRLKGWLLIGLQLVVLGMLLSFPVQGYGTWSITFSSIHLILSYLLLAALWRQSRAWPPRGSRLLTRWSIRLFILSTLGVWAIAPIIATGSQGHEIYYWSIQFFLHFQFNGWFWFAAMALGIRWAERNGIHFEMDRLTLSLWLISAVLTYALAIAWSEPHPLVFGTVSIGVSLQVWAAYRTLIGLRGVGAKAHDRFPSWSRILIGIALVSMALKVVVQAAVAIPSVAVMALTIRHYVMGFIHMNTLGTMTMLLLAYAVYHGWCDPKRWIGRTGLVLIAAGIIGSEVLLFTQGTFFWAGLGLIPGHYWHMVLFSALIPMGVALLLLGAFRRTPLHVGASSVPEPQGTP